MYQILHKYSAPFACMMYEETGNNKVQLILLGFVEWLSCWMLWWYLYRLWAGFVLSKNCWDFFVAQYFNEIATVTRISSIIRHLQTESRVWFIPHLGSLKFLENISAIWRENLKNHLRAKFGFIAKIFKLHSSL